MVVPQMRPVVYPGFFGWMDIQILPVVDGYPQIWEVEVETHLIRFVNGWIPF